METLERLNYEAPSCEEIRIRVEAGILTMSGRDNEGELGGYWDDEG